MTQNVFLGARRIVFPFVEKFSLLDNPDAFPLHVRLLKEEVIELHQAVEDYENDPSVENLAEYFKELTDCHFIGVVLTILQDSGAWYTEEQRNEALTLVHIAGAMAKEIDRLVDQSGYFGFTLDTLKEVTRSNLSKVGPEGVPLRRDDGKILKGPNYSPADMMPFAKRLLEGH